MPPAPFNLWSVTKGVQEHRKHRTSTETPPTTRAGRHNRWLCVIRVCAEGGSRPALLREHELEHGSTSHHVRDRRAAE